MGMLHIVLLFLASSLLQPVEVVPTAIENDRLSQATSAESAAQSDSAAVKKAVMAFIAALNRLDLDGVAATFSEDATAFYPFSFTPHRLAGREHIRNAQGRAFDWARQQLSATTDGELTLNLRPTDMHVRMIGSQAAVVTWHSTRPTHAGRRTAVMEKVDGRWLMVSHHASNMTTPE